MNKNISWDLNGGQSLEEFWGDNRGPVERREDRGAMNKYVLQMYHSTQMTLWWLMCYFISWTKESGSIWLQHADRAVRESLCEIFQLPTRDLGHLGVHFHIYLFLCIIALLTQLLASFCVYINQIRTKILVCAATFHGYGNAILETWK